MELNEIRDKVLEHDKSLSNFDNWAEQTEKRIAELEKSRDVMSDVKIALAELKMSNKYFTDKLDELKASIERINTDNKEQHDAIGRRVKDIEDKPGRSWDKLIWLVIAAVVGGIVGYLINNNLLK
jgi:DNA repair exonuclease SbcCD ATPase subunit